MGGRGGTKRQLTSPVQNVDNGQISIFVKYLIPLVCVAQMTAAEICRDR